MNSIKLCLLWALARHKTWFAQKKLPRNKINSIHHRKICKFCYKFFTNPRKSLSWKKTFVCILKAELSLFHEWIYIIFSFCRWIFSYLHAKLWNTRHKKAFLHSKCVETNAHKWNCQVGWECERDRERVKLTANMNFIDFLIRPQHLQFVFRFPGVNESQKENTETKLSINQTLPIDFISICFRPQTDTVSEGRSFQLGSWPPS